MGDYTHLKDISVNGRVTSARQSMLIGSAKEPFPAANEDNLGLLLMFTGTSTVNYTQGVVYECYQTEAGVYGWRPLKSSSEVKWGSIQGTLSDQTDLSTALGSKANASDLAAKQNKLVAGTNITIDEETNVISATGGGTTYEAGQGIDITGNVITNIARPDVDKNYVNTELGKKQNTLAAGTNITIENNVVAVADGVRKIIIDSVEPTAGVGNDGDIYIQIPSP